MRTETQSRIIVIGASAGGVETLRALAGHLPRGLAAPVAVVLLVGARSILTELPDAAGPLRARHAENGEQDTTGAIPIPL